MKSIKSTITMILILLAASVYLVGCGGGDAGMGGGKNVSSYSSGVSLN